MPVSVKAVGDPVLQRLDGGVVDHVRTLFDAQQDQLIRGKIQLFPLCAYPVSHFQVQAIQVDVALPVNVQLVILWVGAVDEMMAQVEPGVLPLHVYV